MEALYNESVIRHDKSEEFFTKRGLTGKLRHNDLKVNEQALKNMLDGDPYWSLNLKSLRKHPIKYHRAVVVLAKSLGLTSTKFLETSHAYIDPAVTLSQLKQAIEELELAIKRGETILFATGHPGSLIGFYHELARHLEAAGAKIFHLEEPITLGDGLWLDSVGYVLAVSDEGSLLHTHEGEGLSQLLKTHNIGWVVADHGFAGAAINAGVNTVALFDTDDPAIPVAAETNPKIIAVPMNDNRKNVNSARALAYFIKELNGRK